MPIEALAHIMMLTLCGSIMRRDDSLEFQIIERQLDVKDDDSHSWAIHIKNLLQKYDLLRPLELLYGMSTKELWKRCVSAKVTGYYQK